jgi:hypothetical protein
LSPHLSSKSPSPHRDGALKDREREKVLKKVEGKVKLQESQHFERTKHLNFKILLQESIFCPTIIPFSKVFPKLFEKVS